MRNLLLLFVAAISISIASPANAQYRHRDGGYRHNGGGNWVGPLVGGMVLGGIIGSMASRPDYGYPPPSVYNEQRYYPVCRNYVVGQDYYGRPIVERICQ